MHRVHVQGSTLSIAHLDECIEWQVNFGFLIKIYKIGGGASKLWLNFSISDGMMLGVWSGEYCSTWKSHLMA